MGYRDETETLRARVRELEAEVESLRAQVDASKGSPNSDTEAVIESTIEGVIDEDTYEEIVGELRRRFKVLGQVQQVGSTLSWSTAANPQQQPTARMITVTVESRKGRTKLRVREDFTTMRATSWGLGLGLGIPVGLAGVGGIVAALSSGVVAGGVGGLAAIGGVALLNWFVRQRIRKTSGERSAEMLELSRTLESLVREGARAPQTKVRVDEAEEAPDHVEEPGTDAGKNRVLAAD